MPGKQLVDQDAGGVLMQSASACATECDKRGAVSCRSFDACPTTIGGKQQFTCYFTDKHASDKGGSIKNSKCTHYSSKLFRIILLAIDLSSTSHIFQNHSPRISQIVVT